MGYYDSEIDLSDILESETYTTIRALEDSAINWSASEDYVSEATSTSDLHTDTSLRKKKYTKTRTPTPYKSQVKLASRYLGEI